MTVTAEQVQKVKDAGFQNVEAVAEACNVTGCRFYLAVAMIEKESRGRNVYGHDSGGALAGFPKPVNQGNFEVFEWLIATGQKGRNGVGPAQLTSKGYFDEMKTKGLKPWEPMDSVPLGVRDLYRYYRAARNNGDTVVEAIRYAGTRYNGADAYGDSLVTVALRWREALGNVDYA